MLEGYSKEIQRLLKAKKIDGGSRVEILKDKEKFEGILMPRAGGNPDFLVLKLDNGYNVGIKYDKSIRIKKTSKEIMSFRKKPKQLSFDSNKPTILILHTGGTVASRVDYRTGGVVTSFEPEELINMFPEIGEIANVKSKLIRQMWSEDMRFEHHQLIAREVAKHCKEEIAGIIITHGTDTLHYTSASLAFMLEDLPIPVVLVGSQRSSDRPSADSAMNLICAAKFIVKTDFAGVAVCMHGSSNDDYCYIHHPCKVRKMHTSRRDAFQPINSKPYAKVWYTEDKIEFLRDDYMKKDSKRQLKLKDKLLKN
ncbi:MAG: Glu-tRNA(Gln) amidotransferase subunit GatD [Fervidobacterium sp.]